MARHQQPKGDYGHSTLRKQEEEKKYLGTGLRLLLLQAPGLMILLSHTMISKLLIQNSTEVDQKLLFETIFMPNISEVYIKATMIAVIDNYVISSFLKYST